MIKASTRNHRRQVYVFDQAQASHYFLGCWRARKTIGAGLRDHLFPVSPTGSPSPTKPSKVHQRSVLSSIVIHSDDDGLESLENCGGDRNCKCASGIEGGEGSSAAPGGRSSRLLCYGNQCLCSSTPLAFEIFALFACSYHLTFPKTYNKLRIS